MTVQRANRAPKAPTLPPETLHLTQLEKKVSTAKAAFDQTGRTLANLNPGDAKYEKASADFVAARATLLSLQREVESFNASPKLPFAERKAKAAETGKSTFEVLTKQPANPYAAASPPPSMTDMRALANAQRENLEMRDWDGRAVWNPTS